MRLLILPFIIAGSLLAGCSTIQKSNEVSSDIEQEYDFINKSFTSHTQPYRNVFHFRKMFVEELSEEQSKLPDWYFKETNFFFDGLPIKDVLEQIARKHTLNFEARTGVDMSHLVSLKRRNLPVGEMLDALTAMTGYQFTVNENNIVINKYITEVFRIDTLAGSSNYSIGKTNLRSNNNTTQSTDQASADLISTTGDEFSTRNGNHNMLSEIIGGVETILGCKDEEITNEDGSLKDRCDFGATASVISSDSSILVRALPSQVEAVRTFITSKNEIAKRQIRATLTIMTVELTNSDQFRLDLGVVEQAIFNSSNFTYGFASDAASNLIGGLAGGDVAQLNYKNAGQLTAEALQQQGRILKKDILRGTSLNNIVSQLTEVDKQNYVSDRPLQQTANVGSATGIEQKVAESGTLLYMLPNIGEKEVILHLSSSHSSLLALDTKGSGDQEVEAPKIGDKYVNTIVKVTPGRPLIIGGTSSTELETKSSETSSFGPGVSRSSVKKNTETIMLLEVEYL